MESYFATFGFSFPVDQLFFGSPVSSKLENVVLVLPFPAVECGWFLGGPPPKPHSSAERDWLSFPRRLSYSLFAPQLSRSHGMTSLVPHFQVLHVPPTGLRASTNSAFNFPQKYHPFDTPPPIVPVTFCYYNSLAHTGRFSPVFFP